MLAYVLELEIDYSVLKDLKCITKVPFMGT